MVNERKHLDGNDRDMANVALYSIIKFIYLGKGFDVLKLSKHPFLCAIAGIPSGMYFDKSLASRVLITLQLFLMAVSGTWAAGSYYMPHLAPGQSEYN